MLGEDWDWSQHVVDHIELHASDYMASISFYATVLAPLGIPSWSEDSGGERLTCFTRVNVVDRHPPTRELHLCFVARSREEVEAFHGAGSRQDIAQTARPAIATTRRGTTRRSSSTPMTTTSRRSIGTWATPVIPDSQFSDDGAAGLEDHCRVNRSHATKLRESATDSTR
jgi:hypothetical protein